MSSSPPASFLFFIEESSFTRRNRDPSTLHPCATAPSTRHSRGSASTEAYAGNSSASPPCPTHPGREAYPNRKKQGTHRLAAAACCSRRRSPCGSPLAVCLSPRCEALLSLSLRGGDRLPALFQSRRPMAVCRRSLYADALCPVRPGVGLQPTP